MSEEIFIMHLKSLSKPFLQNGFFFLLYFSVRHRSEKAEAREAESPSAGSGRISGKERAKRRNRHG